MSRSKPRLELLGPVQVVWEGQPLPLPSSRKTRALLAYLALSPQRHARQQLCELLWDVPDDPRASLRWSLSKLRKLFEPTGCQPIEATGDWIRFDADQCDIDMLEMRNAVSLGAHPDMEAAWELGNQPLLIDCEYPNQADYQAWLDRRRSDLARLQWDICRTAVGEQSIEPAERKRWAMRWLGTAPLDSDAARAAVAAHIAAGQKLDAARLREDLVARFEEAGHASPFRDGATAGGEAPSRRSTGLGMAPLPQQDIQFVRTRDNVTIAWGSVGDPANPPLVKAANWLTHMELDWQAPIWSPLYRQLAESFRFIRYDERGCGLSDWDLRELSFESFVTDLKQVADAAGLERFPLLGISQGAAVSIEFAVRYPARVSHLILFGGYDRGWRHMASGDEVREREAVMVLTETGWGRANPAYRHMFSKTFMPDATAEELEWFDEFQRQTASAKNAVRFLDAFSRIDVRDRLADIACPTLVIHSRGDQRIPIETGRGLAAQIPGARFASIESNNHLLLGREPASAEFVRLVRDFLENPA